MTNEFFRSFKAIIIAIALTIITAIVGWIFVTNTLSLKKTPINISDTSFDWSSLKAGDHVVCIYIGVVSSIHTCFKVNYFTCS